MKNPSEVLVESVFPALNEAILCLRTHAAYRINADDKIKNNRNVFYDMEYKYIREAIVDYLDTTYEHHKNTSQNILHCMSVYADEANATRYDVQKICANVRWLNHIFSSRGQIGDVDSAIDFSSECKSIVNDID